MRHIATLIAAIVLGSSAWILLAFGQDRSAEVFAEADRSGTFRTDGFVGPLLFLAGAGLLLGLLGTLRLSPLGVTVLGVVYTSSYTLLLIAPKGTLGLLPNDLSVSGRHADLTTPIRTGTTVVLGMLLLAAAVNIGRRRRRPAPIPANETAGVERTDPDLSVRYVTRSQPATYGSRWSTDVEETSDAYRW